MTKLSYKLSEETRQKMSKAHLGKKRTEEHKRNMSIAMKGFKRSPFTEEHKLKLSQSHLGQKCSPETRLKMSLSGKGKNKGNQYVKGHKWTEERKKRFSILKTGIRIPKLQGANHHGWISDRTLLKTKGDRRSYAYSNWRKEVWNRDKFKCRIADEDCKGQLQAHHILRWVEYPKLRYEVNNGITLCHFHHPRKRVDEINLSPFFQKLVNIN